MTIQFTRNKILNYKFLRVLVENYQNTPHLSRNLVYIDVLGGRPLIILITSWTSAVRRRRGGDPMLVDSSLF